MRASSSGVTRSVLLSSTTSAKAIWSSASRLSFRRSGRCLASTSATTASSSVLARTSSSMKKVWATGTGSARPVVSTMMRIEAAGAAHQAFDDADQVAAHGAADAAIVHLVDFFVGFDDQVVVDADLAELVDDDGIFLAVVLGEDAVEQRRLAGAEIAGEHGDGNGLLRWLFRSWEPRRWGSLWAEWSVPYKDLPRPVQRLLYVIWSHRGGAVNDKTNVKDKSIFI